MSPELLDYPGPAGAAPDGGGAAGAFHRAGVEAIRAERHARGAELIAEAIRLDPAEGDYYADLGVALMRLGEGEAAEAGFRAAIHLKPQGPAPYNSLGALLIEQGRLEQAEAVLRQAVALHPRFSEAHGNLGCVLQARGRAAEARLVFYRALRLSPYSANLYANLGVALTDLGKVEAAADSFAAALHLCPDLIDAWCGYGGALCQMGRLDEALAAFDEALARRPACAAAHNDRGVALQRLGRWEEAIAAFRETLRLDPGHPDALANLGLVLLLLGRYEEGWPAHEGRWRSRYMALGLRHFEQPQWDGEPFDGTLLVHAEQGLGDTLQFCRYAPRLAERQRVVFEVQPSLVSLLRRTMGDVEVVARGAPLPPFEAHCPLMSLPLLFGSTLGTIPAPAAYLAADPAKVRAWAERLAGLKGLRCGLVWAGGARPGQPQVAATDGRRSLSLHQLAPLGRAPGVSFVSLQKGPAAAQAAEPPPGLTLLDLTHDLHDFDDTAGLVANLDLVISVDTAVAHLAGALGKPTWLLNRFDTCWRWLLGREDSPWYPSVRIFRQPGPGAWTAPIEAMGQALAQAAVCEPIR